MRVTLPLKKHIRRFVLVHLVIFLSACSIVTQAPSPLPTSTSAQTLPPTRAASPQPPTPTMGLTTFTPSPTEQTGPVIGCNVKFITDRILQGGMPSYSPSGELLVFACGPFLEAVTCIMKPDGTGLKEVAPLDPYGPDPQWSPNGDSIAVTLNTSSGGNSSGIMDIYLISPKGDILKQITHNPTSTGNPIVDIQWSPDGQQIAFSTDAVIDSEKADIYLVKSDGTDLQRLTHPPALHWYPRWSPDGERLAYIAKSNDITYLVIVDLDGGLERRQIALDIRGDLSWSPDGGSLIYSSKRDNNYDLYEYDLIGEQEQRHTSDSEVDVEPRYSLDGSTILFRSSRSGKHEIYTMDSEDNEPIRQAINTTDDFMVDPHWSLDNRGIYFFLFDSLDNVYELWSIDMVDSCD